MTNVVRLPAVADAAATQLEFYDAAKAALARACSVDEVKEIRDRAVAIQAYSRQVRDGQLQADAMEIRKRAERMLGKKIGEAARAGELSRGAIDENAPGRGRGGRQQSRGANNPTIITLTQAGIDKTLAKQVRRLASVPENRFEAVFRRDVRPVIESGKGLSNRAVDRILIGDDRPEPQPVEINRGVSIAWQWWEKLREGDQMERLKQIVRERRSVRPEGIENLAITLDAVIEDLTGIVRKLRQ